jgi:hypothetical protein
MSRLLVALGPGAGVDPVGLVAAWNADDQAVAAGVARVEAAGPGEFIPGVMELVVVPLAVNLASSAVYDVLKNVLGRLRHEHGQSAEPQLSQTRTSGGDLVVVIRVGGPGS